jgi:hypothetical protein
LSRLPCARRRLELYLRFRASPKLCSHWAQAIVWSVSRITAVIPQPCFRCRRYVRPHEREAVAPRIPVNPNLIAFLTHAGTGLMTLNRARPDLPAGLAVLGLSLLSISSEEQMIATLNGELAEAAVVMLRIHGRVEAVPAFELLKERCRERGQRLLFVSGTGELDPQMAQSSDVPLDTLQAVTSYLPRELCPG